jgi:hypothetical protein
MIKVKPLGDYIVYKANVVKLSSGIIVAGSVPTSSSLLKNIVKEVGPDVKGKIKRGDEIIITSRQRLKLDYPARDIEPDLFMVKEEEVCAVFEK